MIKKCEGWLSLPVWASSDEKLHALLDKDNELCLVMSFPGHDTIGNPIEENESTFLDLNEAKELADFIYDMIKEANAR